MKKNIPVWLVILSTLFVGGNINAQAQDYSGVETLDLAQLEAEIKDAKFLRGLDKTKNLIDRKHGCGEYLDVIKEQRQSLLKLQTQYQSNPVNGTYMQKDKAYRIAFTKALQNYEKCFDEKLFDFPSFVNATHISDYNTFKERRKILRSTLAKRGDLDTYITMLDELIDFEKKNAVEAAIEQPSATLNINDNVLTRSPPSITMSSASALITKLVTAYHDSDFEGVSTKLAGPLQGILLQNIEEVGGAKGLHKTFHLPQTYSYWKIKCAACWQDDKHGNVCQFAVRTYWPQGNGLSYETDLFTLKNQSIGASGFSPKITAVTPWEYHKYKKLKKNKGKVCKGFPKHFSRN